MSKHSFPFCIPTLFHESPGYLGFTDGCLTEDGTMAPPLLGRPRTGRTRVPVNISRSGNTHRPDTGDGRPSGPWKSLQVNEKVRKVRGSQQRLSVIERTNIVFIGREVSETRWRRSRNHPSPKFSYFYMVLIRHFTILYSSALQTKRLLPK